MFIFASGHHPVAVWSADKTVRVLPDPCLIARTVSATGEVDPDALKFASGSVKTGSRPSRRPSDCSGEVAPQIQPCSGGCTATVTKIFPIAPSGVLHVPDGRPKRCPAGHHVAPGYLFHSSHVRF